MKKFILGFICGLLLMGTTFAATELNVVPNPFPVFINGVQAAVEGYNINGFTYLKLADFKQAGLIVKFNETDKQIEITKDTDNSATETSQNLQTPESPETIVPIVTLPAKSSEPQGVIIEEDGLTYLMLSNVKYVGFTGIREKYTFINPLYDFFFNAAEQKIDICDMETLEVILSDLPFIVYENTTYTDYNYFKVNILPLLK